ncbi:hypothetical protein snork91_gp061 [Flavobacterium phage vB_FspS_snork9-1]|uniref:Uncharacterized protein n=6 Tax=Caudoviricetes TaxID=2731619 RepID=A0A6B9LAV5_9CAUD|nr:hypothetical protein HWC91_gp61 [Flavobacterium phage vB_FspS_lillamy9-1]YP_009855271.1 hypothetical protein HWC96_gp61 [Flavobacterium phage vB_FspS_snork6-1]QHB39162.1 hypothetical protein lillamy92_gp061 [Flavobacterium phage vB_FspS_lillamy9-2]QHB39381.1 hypothetical protein lillamy95_gp061 [Flavobacterium phage vB_FspS_lillamy9-5]QHB39729.1 hypothetical protein mumin62_gp055 [Flavobacterium phage vB_FspS_mumin6-2]QHB40562.1 hypothetical protein snork91_gp061 [Flavobacterium phage vB_Fs
MGLISAVVNNLSCGANSQLGTGTKFCPQDIENPTVVVFAEKGTKFAPSDDLTLSAVQELQQTGKLIVLSGVVSFTDNTAENTTGTRESTGIKYTTLLNPYDFTFVFDNGLHFHKALTKLEGSKNYDMFIFDIKNDMFGALDRQGNFRGLDCQYVGVGGYKIGMENSQSLMVQISRTQFDSDVAFVSNENLDFTAEQDLDGYNDIEIALTAPADTATSLAIKVYAKSNNKLVALTGLEKEDFLLKIDGVTTTITALIYGSVDGEYTLTVPAFTTGDAVSLQLFDSVLNASIINVDGTMYKSNVATTVVV